MSIQLVFSTSDLFFGVGKKVSEILQVCCAEDIQPLALAGLESFGHWIVADKTRVAHAGKALATNDTPLRIANALLGLSSQSVARAFRESDSLKATFAFIAGCSMMSCSNVGSLIHEILSRRSNTPISSTQISSVVERVRGYRDFIPGPTPYDIFNQIGRGYTNEVISQGLCSDAIYLDTDIEDLAVLILNVFDALQNDENDMVHMRGNRMAIWLASLFVWLKPKEVEVYAGEVRIYPALSEGGTGHVARLSIVITQVTEHDPDNEWKVQEWRRVPGYDLPEVLAPIPIKTTQSNSLGHRNLHRIPIKDARDQILVCISSNSHFLGYIGNLATALICMAVENGTLRDHYGDNKILLRSICSKGFRQSHENAMLVFGWDEMDGNKVDQIVSSLMKVMESGRKTLDPSTYIEKIQKITQSADQAAKERGETRLLPPTKDAADDVIIIEFAVHLAMEAIYFSVCEELPANAVYRPCEPVILRENAKLLFDLAFRNTKFTYTQESRGDLCRYSEFKNRVWAAMVQEPGDIKISDLAVSSGGYIIYQGLLDHLGGGRAITDRRLAASVRVRPGVLKLEGKGAHFSRLAETLDNPTRTLFVRPRFREEAQPVQLLAADQTFQGIADADAVEKTSTSVEHSMLANDSNGTLSIVTYIRREGKEPNTISRIPASWETSILTVVFAHHCEVKHVRTSQLADLSAMWNEEGHLGWNLQWCAVGRDMGTVERCITKTQNNELLRFFEAGNLAFLSVFPIFIRPSKVPLVFCVKEAMENAKEGWVLIA